MQVTLTDLEEITGVTYKTLKKRLQPLTPTKKTNKEIYYPLKESLKLVLIQPKGKLSLEEERAKLTILQAELLQKQIEKEEGETLNAKEVEEQWSKLLIAFKTKVLAIPTKTAAQFKAFTHPSDLEEFLDDLVRETLTELAQPE